MSTLAGTQKHLYEYMVTTSLLRDMATISREAVVQSIDLYKVTAIDVLVFW
jgi:hypothetical protein